MSTASRQATSLEPFLLLAESSPGRVSGGAVDTVLSRSNFRGTFTPGSHEFGGHAGLFCTSAFFPYDLLVSM